MSRVVHPAVLLAFLALAATPGQSRAQAQADPERLATLLERAANYCRKLDRAALDFICFEEVKELADRHLRRFDTFLYDYQFVRKKDDVKEDRKLVAVDGRKAPRALPPVQPAAFRYRNVLFGPIGLLSEHWQSFHVYRIVGAETLFGEKTVVVEATPLPKTHESHPYGRIWVRETDGSVLKIVWDQASLGNFAEIAEWAAANEAEPMITAYSEYRFEKNRLRFPSRSYTRQAYIRKDGSKFVNAELSVVYKDYKFFTVETEVAY